jgi:gliding motility-associated protein GldM
MSLPKEPRQKMINIMYLVLTALLALNVSSEILNAFKTIDLSLSESNNIIQKSNSSVLSSLTELTNDPSNREEALFWLPKAEKAQKISDVIYNQIEDLKKDLKLGSGLKMDGEKEIYNIDNLEAVI